MKEASENLLETVGALVDAWCDRRCFGALRCILRGYPLTNNLTDGWAILLESLEDVRSFARGELTENEMNTVNQLIGSISRIVYRR